MDDGKPDLMEKAALIASFLGCSKEKLEGLLSLPESELERWVKERQWVEQFINFAEGSMDGLVRMGERIRDIITGARSEQGEILQEIKTVINIYDEYDEVSSEESQ